MMEWLQNVNNWFEENWPNILAILQSGTVVGIVTAIVAIIKMFGKIKTNTNNSKLLNGALGVNSDINAKLTSAVEALKSENTQLKQTVSVLTTKLNDVVDSDDKLLVKVNAILEVQSLVYQTVKNEDTRTAVMNILSNAKYSETSTRQALLDKIETLQNEVKEITEATTQKLEEVVKESKQLLTSTDDGTTVPRS